ncbi:uncharacterized protein CELE_B0302.5 [Caenorhabditis elegans]|uniref:Uncharacterized protein AH9.3 n=2 Tax=Caenorhabditis elegans TaxID=6239 RepID=YWO3_CAEEL|nr:Uncharacterized protein CELE_B0302.5 [Caenorhabditis elegans]Q10906.2 RecName: Full=Uncharacterized protein AH9.3 [Caenorhabditis elegans]Q10928.2 RecName: Full=Uncharacterized protein B0302.5 [Caenorhabditis elegans]CCD61700.1 Uncharacterized protein CELE_B0302.5 [Caenorhabditis elegans]|eukprot:NP_510785.2 Uncharacterized protein CELE_B0302.5 [Caenorhabditis elegans]
MTAIRDNLCELKRLEIPRPKCQGMQFVATRGRQGFYRTIRENGAMYGIQLKPQGPKRPQLSSDLFNRPMTVPEENSEDVEEAQTSQPETRKVEMNNNNNYKISYTSRPPLPPQQPKQTYTLQRTTPQAQPTPQQPRMFSRSSGGITGAVNNRPQMVAQQREIAQK